MKFRLSLIFSVFLLVVTPIVITSLVTMEAADKALQSRATGSELVVTSENAEINHLRESIIYMLIIGTVVSITGAGIFTSELANSVSVIKNGLDALSRDVNITIRPLRGVLGEITQSINQMAETLRETRNHRDALLQSSPNGIITVDKQGKIILFNPAVANLTGIEQNQALGANYQDAGFDQSLVHLIEATLNNEALVSAKEEILFRPDGSTVAVAITGSKLYDFKSELVGALAVIIDLREKRLLEAQVLQANRLAGLGELAAGVAHEIRNPLTAIKGYTQILDEELSVNDLKREYIEVILKEVNRLDRIVNGLLAFARPSTSHYRMLDLHDVIEETLVLIDNSAFRQRIELQKDYGKDMRAEVDKDQLKQVLLNLLLNATQAIAEKGKIKIVTHREDGRVSISVIDSGSGIPQENIDKLFDPFFTTKDKGTGLGLAIVHRLLELHQGKAIVRSVQGKGTEFKVILPIRQGGKPIG